MLYVVASICLIWVSGFLCWALYETARLMRQSNEVVTDVREKVEAVEAYVDEAIDKISSLSSYAGMLSRAGESVLGLIGGRRSHDEDMPRRKTKRISRRIVEEDEE
jgi:hypothetical protein